MTDKAVIDRARRSGGKLRRHYLVRRATNATHINDYNADITLLWQGNTDLSYVTDIKVA